MSVNQQAAAQPANPHSPDDIRAELRRIEASLVFADARRLRDFLGYVVEESLSGRAHRIKGFTVAQDVFELHDPEDARTSTLVRVEAGRLRRRLIEYYADEGRDDPLRIDVPKGGYVPCFDINVPPPGLTDATAVVGADSADHTFRLGPRAAIASFLLAAMVAALVYLQPWRTGDDFGIATEAAVQNLRPAIAILPFENATGDGTADLMALGLTEDINTDLSKMSAVDVIAQSSVALLDHRTMDPTAVREQLGVTHVLRGSVRGNPPNYRITAQLFDARTNRQVWAERFDRNADNMLEVQDELAARVVQGMSTSLAGNQPGRLADHNYVRNEAKVLYRQAMDLVNPPGDVGRLLVARQAFERAIEIDGNYADAYAGLAYTYIFGVLFTHSADPGADRKTAVALAEQALAADPSTGLAYTTLAFAELSRGNHAEALRLSTRAVEAQPGEPYLNAYHAYILAADGRAADGIPYAERALRLDPLTVRAPYLNILGFVSFHAGEYQKSIDAYEQSRERGGPSMAIHQAYVVAAKVGLGRVDDAKEALRILDSYGYGDGTDSRLLKYFRRPEDAERFLALLREARN